MTMFNPLKIVDTAAYILFLNTILKMKTRMECVWNCTRGYALIHINYVDNEVSMRHFSPEQKNMANDSYAICERGLKRGEAAVVLVAVSDVKELREAYPSYFLNAKEFVDALTEFKNACKLKGYIE